jgi:2-dehydro-3-deoxygalactonokinase
LGDLFIAGDWGTTSMRLHLCRPRQAGAEVLATVSGSGVKSCQDFEGEFFRAAQPWLDRHGKLPVFLAGMIGSNIGWCHAPYVPCPAGQALMREQVLRFDARGISFAISPGLRCTNMFGLPDVMRGEEMQLFGWIALAGAEARQRIVCLPGTHAKWAMVEDGAVTGFFTSMQGELFEILLAHSLVGRGVPQPPAREPIKDTDPAFGEGLATMIKDPTLSAGHAVFSARSRCVTGDLCPADAPAFLSGLLIGAEVRDAVAAFRSRGHPTDTVTLIGPDMLMALYSRALASMGIGFDQVPAQTASISGLSALDAPKVQA